MLGKKINSTYIFTKLSMSSMCTSLKVRWKNLEPFPCSPPNSTTRERSIFVKENPAQGGGRGPVVSGELQVAAEWRDEVYTFPECTCGIH